MERLSPLPRISVKPLGDALGAAITGIDLSQQLDDVTIARVRDAWREYLVLVFPGQHIGPEAQTIFCRAFGKLKVIQPAAHQIAGQPYVKYVSNIQDPAIKAVHESGEMQFHADQSYLKVPCIATTLYALEVPKVGGNTLFINCYDAFDALPDDLKKAIAGRKALNVFDGNVVSARRGKTDSDAPRYWHPMVWIHPETGRESLAVNRMMTQAIEGLVDTEGNALLQRLFEHLEQDRFIYEHVWAPDDFLMWDNRCTLHARRAFDPQERRLLRRITIHADKA